jgi:arylsulfatase A-like enzyme
MEDIYIRLDKELEHLLNFVDAEIGLKNVLVYLTADNAAANPPSYLSGRKMPGGYFNYNSALSLLKSYLNVVYGKGEWVNFYYAQQIFLNRELIESSKLPLADFQEKVAGFMVQFDGVSNALTANDLMKNNYTHGNFERMQKSYNQKRSGDVLLNISAGWVEKGADRQYASSFHYDSHVPLVWYGWKVGRQEISSKVSITDIAPTIASLLQISGPSSMQGKVISEIFK